MGHTYVHSKINGREKDCMSLCMTRPHSKQYFIGHNWDYNKLKWILDSYEQYIYIFLWAGGGDGKVKWGDIIVYTTHHCHLIFFPSLRSDIEKIHDRPWKESLTGNAHDLLARYANTPWFSLHIEHKNGSSKLSGIFIAFLHSQPRPTNCLLSSYK